VDLYFLVGGAAAKAHIVCLGLSCLICAGFPVVDASVSPIPEFAFGNICVLQSAVIPIVE